MDGIGAGRGRGRGGKGDLFFIGSLMAWGVGCGRDGTGVEGLGRSGGGLEGWEGFDVFDGGGGTYGWMIVRFVGLDALLRGVFWWSGVYLWADGCLYWDARWERWMWRWVSLSVGS